MPTFEFTAHHYPTQPGCYIMRDSRGQVIYVGKAKNLRKRLASYFQPSRKTGRTSRLAARIAEIEVILVNNEIESLVLENNLIKRYRPRYNRMLKWDGSGYYYIVLTDEAVPRFLPYRKNRYNKALEKIQGAGIQQRFGPYISYNYRNRLIDHVNETFQVRTCTELPSQVCLRFHIQRCSGICEGKITASGYAVNLRQAVDFLTGSHAQVIHTMRQQMAAAAEALEFERAQRIKEHIKVLETTLASQVVERNANDNQDVIFFGDEGALVAEVRQGMVQGMCLEEYPLGDLSGDTFLLAHYFRNSPGEIITNRCDNLLQIEHALTSSNGYPVTVILPQAGIPANLIELCALNYDYRVTATHRTTEAE